MSLNVSAITLSGVFDGTKASFFQDEVRQALEANADAILIDCSELSFMDSSGLGAMIVALKNIRAEGKNLYLCAINPQVEMLFDLTDTRRIFKIFSDRTAFEKAVLGQSTS